MPHTSTHEHAYIDKFYLNLRLTHFHLFFLCSSYGVLLLLFFRRFVSHSHSHSDYYVMCGNNNPHPYTHTQVSYSLTSFYDSIEINVILLISMRYSNTHTQEHAQAYIIMGCFFPVYFFFFRSMNILLAKYILIQYTNTLTTHTATLYKQ